MSIEDEDEQFDTEQYDDLWEAIRHKGELVGRQEWDSGAPGAGAGVVDVYLYRGAFYADNDAETYGPCKTFEEAAKAAGLLIETSATTRIWVDRNSMGVTSTERRTRGLREPAHSYQTISSAQRDAVALSTMPSSRT